MTYDFRGKTAVVTGASRGLGEAIARTLAADGARVVLVARSGDALKALAADLPHDPVVIEADLSQPDGWRAAADAVLAAVPTIDILVNNAGVSGRQKINEMQAEDLDKVLTVNVRNLIMLTSALTERLVAARGNVVNISSVSSFSGAIGQIAYATSKGAVNAFTRNASLDLGRSGVRVNAVAPGVIDDGMWKTAFASGVDRQKTFDAMRRLLPLEGRWGAAQDIADAVAWLASDKAGYVTGQVIRVDGGMVV
jgi:NAD(P)-dependent dehydrogenase (short-subunit alcohol dehydrogenase family)